jgi:hypothetical protein
MKKNQKLPVVLEVLAGAAFLFVFFMNISLFTGTENNSGLTLGALEAIAQPSGEDDPEEGDCFDTFVMSCPKIWGQDGGQQKICDSTGDYRAGQVCTEVDCFTTDEDEVTCQP